MSWKQKLKIVLILLMLPLLYAGLYLGLVEKRVAVAKTAHKTIKITHPVYRLINYNLTRKIFSPAHDLDRRIRKAYWESLD